jgi:long-chain acyl-CoA synthetase
MRNFQTEFWRTLQGHKDATALVRRGDEGELETRSFWEWTRRVQRLAIAMLDEGFEAGTRVAIVAQNSQDWIDFAFASWLVGGCLVPLVSDRSRGETLKACARSGASWIAVEDVHALEHVRGQGEGMPEHLQWVCFKAKDAPESGNVHTLDEFDERGRSLAVRGRVDELAEHIYGLELDAPALILFDPEDVEDPHGAYFNGEKVAHMLRWLGDDLRFEPEEDRLACALNFGWFQGWLLTAAWLLEGGAVAQGSSIRETLDDLAVLSPTHLVCGPAYLEHRTIDLREKLADVPEFATAQQEDGGSVLSGFLERITERGAHKLFFAPFEKALGGRLEQALLVGGRLPDDVYDALSQSSLSLLGVWGLPEAGISHMERPGAQRRGSVGRPVQGYVCKIENAKGDEEGPILLRSQALFDGYWDGEGPREKDGDWLRTGAVGRVSSGYLYLA